MVANERNPDAEFGESRIVELTYEEALAMFDETAQRYMNMSGEEFLRRWKTGDFEVPESFEVIYVGVR